MNGFRPDSSDLSNLEVDYLSRRKRSDDDDDEDDDLPTSVSLMKPSTMRAGGGVSSLLDFRSK